MWFEFVFPQKNRFPSERMQDGGWRTLPPFPPLGRPVPLCAFEAPRTNGAVAPQPISIPWYVPRAGQRCVRPGTPPTALCAPRPRERGAQPSRQHRLWRGAVKSCPTRALRCPGLHLPGGFSGRPPSLPHRGWSTKPRPPHPRVPLQTCHERLAGRLVLGSDRPPYQRPLSNTRPLHHQNSVGTCCVQCVAQ